MMTTCGWSFALTLDRATAEVHAASCNIVHHVIALLHQSPRQFGKARSTWTLALAAEVCAEHGITAERVSDETIRDALKRLGVGWRRAKTWITSPDPQYALKKTGVTA